MRGKILRSKLVADNYGMLIGEPIELHPCLQPHIFPSDITQEEFIKHFEGNVQVLGQLQFYDLINVEIIETI